MILNAIEWGVISLVEIKWDHTKSNNWLICNWMGSIGWNYMEWDGMIWNGIKLKDSYRWNEIKRNWMDWNEYEWIVMIWIKLGWVVGSLSEMDWDLI